MDALVALFTGKTMGSFDYRSNVWVWWSKIAVQFVTAYVVRIYMDSHRAGTPANDIDVEFGQLDADNQVVEFWQRQDLLGRPLEAREIALIHVVPVGLPHMV